MSLFDKWAENAEAMIRAESNLVRATTGHGTMMGNAREYVVRQVLGRILPPAYEIGTGQVVDSFGGRSNQIDVIIARRDVPRLTLPDGTCQYPVEGVIATIEVKSRLNSVKLPEALSNCASVAALKVRVPDVEFSAFGKGTSMEGVRPSQGIEMSRHHPLLAAAYDRLGKPATYIYGYSGYKENKEHLVDCIKNWIQGEYLRLIRLPSLITTEGLSMLRNDYNPRRDTYTGTYKNDGEDIVPLATILRPASPLQIFIRRLLVHLTESMPLTPSGGCTPVLENYINSNFVIPEIIHINTDPPLRRVPNFRTMNFQGNR